MERSIEAPFRVAMACLMADVHTYVADMANRDGQEVIASWHALDYQCSPGLIGADEQPAVEG